MELSKYSIAELSQVSWDAEIKYELRSELESRSDRLHAEIAKKKKRIQKLQSEIDGLVSDCESLTRTYQKVIKLGC